MAIPAREANPKLFVTPIFGRDSVRSQWPNPTASPSVILSAVCRSDPDSAAIKSKFPATRQQPETANAPPVKHRRQAGVQVFPISDIGLFYLTLILRFV